MAENILNRASVIKSDENVILFPSIVSPILGDASRWRIKIHGWIFEPEFEGIKRRLLLKSFCSSLNLFDKDCDSEIFNERAKYFLVDNERDKSIRLEFAGRAVLSEPSGKDGHFRAEIEISPEEAKQLRATTSESGFSIKVISGAANDRVFSGKIFSLAEDGVAVISDIDDTIKESNVTNKSELLKNTFIRPFIAFPSMLNLYQSLKKEGATFHYITASPWQLYPTLSDFIKNSDYPEGTFHMKEFRWKDSRFFDLFSSPEKLKVPIIESFVKDFPKKKFILIGDSSEKDPQIYADIARRFPLQDIQIIIRSLPNAPIDSAKSAEVFYGIKQDRWKILYE